MTKGAPSTQENSRQARACENAVAAAVVQLHDVVTRHLLAERRGAAYWEGELASSALATATALAALRRAGRLGLLPQDAVDGPCRKALRWLLADQNEDGSWGDAPGCRGNVSATYLVLAVLSDCAGTEPLVVEACDRARDYLARAGELRALRERYGDDRTFVVPILAFLAMHGLLDWSQVPGLPFELGILPHRLLRRFKVGVVSYALPALIAIGYAVARRRGGTSLRRLCWPVVVPLALRRLARLQPESGGYLEAVPLTAFVTLSLMEVGEGESSVVSRGLRFLLDLQRSDGSWPVDANLSCWVTSLSLQALQQVQEIAETYGDQIAASVRWLLERQCRSRHPYTDAAPGGWGWSHLSGSVPDVDDTSAALLALSPHGSKPEVREAAFHGIDWLLGVQNSDGGWPTFCRGWGWLPFDRSAPDLTAHALRALAAWLDRTEGRRRRRLTEAIGAGLRYLRRVQHADGTFVPLWFGNEWQAREENPVYGSARVLSAYVELKARGLLDDPDLEAMERTRGWLVAARNGDGSWGGDVGLPGTVEETALALAALAPDDAVPVGWLEPTLTWLQNRVDTADRLAPAPIGLYFAKLWYFERLYPVVFLAMGLGALRRRVTMEMTAHDWSSPRRGDA